MELSGEDTGSSDAVSLSALLLLSTSLCALWWYYWHRRRSLAPASPGEAVDRNVRAGDEESAEARVGDGEDASDVSDEDAPLLARRRGATPRRAAAAGGGGGGGTSAGARERGLISGAHSVEMSPAATRRPQRKVKATPPNEPVTPTPQRGAVRRKGTGMGGRRPVADTEGHAVASAHAAAAALAADAQRIADEAAAAARRSKAASLELHKEAEHAVRRDRAEMEARVDVPASTDAMPRSVRNTAAAAVTTADVRDEAASAALKRQTVPLARAQVPPPAPRVETGQSAAVATEASPSTAGNGAGSDRARTALREPLCAVLQEASDVLSRNDASGAQQGDVAESEVSKLYDAVANARRIFADDGASTALLESALKSLRAAVEAARRTVLRREGDAIRTAARDLQAAGEAVHSVSAGVSSMFSGLRAPTGLLGVIRQATVAVEEASDARGAIGAVPPEGSWSSDVGDLWRFVETSARVVGQAKQAVDAVAKAVAESYQPSSPLRCNAAEVEQRVKLAVRADDNVAEKVTFMRVALADRERLSFALHAKHEDADVVSFAERVVSAISSLLRGRSSVSNAQRSVDDHENGALLAAWESLDAAERELVVVRAAAAALPADAVSPAAKHLEIATEAIETAHRLDPRGSTVEGISHSTRDSVVAGGGDAVEASAKLWQFVAACDQLARLVAAAASAVAGIRDDAMARSLKQLAKLSGRVEALLRRNLAAGSPTDAVSARLEAIASRLAALQREREAVADRDSAAQNQFRESVEELSLLHAAAVKALHGREDAAYRAAVAQFESLVKRLEDIAARAEALRAGSAHTSSAGAAANGEDGDGDDVEGGAGSTDEEAARSAMHDAQQLLDDAAEGRKAIELSLESDADRPSASELWEFVWSLADIEAAVAAAGVAVDVALEARVPQVAKPSALSKFRSAGLAVVTTVRMQKRSLDIRAIASPAAMAAPTPRPVAAAAAHFAHLSDDALTFIHFAATLLPRRLTEGKSAAEIADVAMLWSLFHHMASAFDPTRATSLSSNGWRKFCREAHIIGPVPGGGGARTKPDANLQPLARADVDMIETLIYRGDRRGARSGSSRSRKHGKAMSFDEFCTAVGMCAAKMYRQRSSSSTDSSGSLRQLLIHHVSPVIEIEAAKAQRSRMMWEVRGGGVGVEEMRANDDDARALLQANAREIAKAFKFYVQEGLHKASAAGKATSGARRVSAARLDDPLSRAVLGTTVVGGGAGGSGSSGAPGGGDEFEEVVGTVSLSGVVSFAKDFGVVPTVVNNRDLLELFTLILYEESVASDDASSVDVVEELSLPGFTTLLARLAMRRTLDGEANIDDVRAGCTAEEARRRLATAVAHVAHFCGALNSSDGFKRVRARSSRGGMGFTRFKVEL